ncbi:MAG: hypothetical protein FJ098_14025, partial [Deltaproteobacteria bacterium]|nr:hypothetical protein [Deltaproteobacteria bacterium]
MAPPPGEDAAPAVDDVTIHEVIRRLEAEYPAWREPVVTQLAGRHRKDPFLVLIGTLLSLRTRDETTAGAIERLRALADNPVDMARLPPEAVARAIYPVGFYNTKA